MPLISLTDYEPETDHLLEEAIAGLSQEPKLLPCKYFYDEYGSRLFDRICELEEYYPTRTELAIMHQSIHEMAALIGEEVLLVEYGAGSCVKIRLLLDALRRPAGFVPIDISREHLVKAAREVHDVYPDLEILPVCADYNKPFEMPQASRAASRRVVYFPGSTIGNFHPSDAHKFLARLRELVGMGGGLLIGVDLKKDPNVLRLAYNDLQGITASFNMNLLTRLNNECGADFDLDRFHHEAAYNEAEGRIEMHLVSDADQTVSLGGQTFHFAEDESIRTECSYKYTVEEFASLARPAGFELRRAWTDQKDYFSVQFLEAV